MVDTELKREGVREGKRAKEGEVYLWFVSWREEGEKERLGRL